MKASNHQCNFQEIQSTVHKVELKLDLLRANWYAEWYTSSLIADEEGWNFQAVKYVMKLDFFQQMAALEFVFHNYLCLKTFKDNFIHLLDHIFTHQHYLLRVVKVTDNWQLDINMNLFDTCLYKQPHHQAWFLVFPSNCLTEKKYAVMFSKVS